jgi:hypothetical protein
VGQGVVAMGCGWWAGHQSLLGSWKVCSTASGLVLVCMLRCSAGIALIAHAWMVLC